MKSIGKKLLSSICAFALAANGAGVMAQKKKPARQVEGKSDNVLTMAAIIDSIEITAVAPAGGGSRALEVANSGAGKGARIGGGSAFQFFSQELSFDNNLVLGSPFSADVSSETIQT